MKGLSPLVRKFVLHWGEMGARWGINRTVAQMHALLYVEGRPMNAEEICEALGVARSNVSNSLRELQNWGIVKVVHLPGDRRDHFESMKDVYEMFRVIVAERKRREVDPTVRILRECVEEAGRGGAGAKKKGREESEDARVRERLESLLGFFELAGDFYDRLDRVPTASAVKAARMGDKLLRLAGLMK